MLAGSSILGPRLLLFAFAPRFGFLPAALHFVGGQGPVPILVPPLENRLDYFLSTSKIFFLCIVVF